MPCLSWPRLASPRLSLPCLALPRLSCAEFLGSLLAKPSPKKAVADLRRGRFAPVGRPPTHEFPHRAVVAASKVVGFATRLRAPKSCVGGGPYDSQKRGPNRPTDLALPRLALPRMALPCLASMQSFLGFFLPPPCERGAGPTPKGAPDDFVWGGQDRTLFAKMGVFFFFSSISLGKNAHFWPTAVRSWGPYDPWRMGRNRLARRR